jgi:hypothetical protein
MDDDDDVNTKFGPKWVRGSRKITTEIGYRVVRDFLLLGHRHSFLGHQSLLLLPHHDCNEESDGQDAQVSAERVSFVCRSPLFTPCQQKARTARGLC